MFRSVIPVVLAVALTACGGGGGSSTSTVTDSNLVLGAVYPDRAPAMVLGKFKDSQTQHVVLAQYRLISKTRSEPGPVKIYKLNNDGTIVDSTVEILGGATVASVNVPLVADFNHDGIDDLFLPGYTDTQDLAPSMAFISRPGQSHIRVDLPDPVWAHGSVVIDANNDGHLDVMDSWGNLWFNDGTGSFTFREHTHRSTPGFWIHGSGICAGDFNNSGRQQIVLTDQMVDSNIGPIADTVIFELGPTGLPVAQHYLPVPVLDKNSTVTEISHDVACRVADFNNDGLLDILVFSRPLPGSTELWSNQGVVQVLINRGNWQFEDVTERSMEQYDTTVLVSYTATVIDLNGDGKLDLWAGYFDFASGNSNQALLNNGSAIFNSVLKSTIAEFQASSGMMPVKFNDKWAFLVARRDTSGSKLYLTKPLYTFN